MSAEALESRVLLSTVNAWKAAVSGDWDTGSNWTLGHIPTAGEDVNIAVAGSYTVTHSFGTDLAHSIALSHPLMLTGGTLTVATSVQANATFTLGGGTLSGATINAGAGGQFAPVSGTLTHATLGSDVTMANGDEITVVKGLSLGGHTLTLSSTGSFTGITFNDAAAESLSGPGHVVLGGSAPNTDFFNTYGAAANPVTLAANVTISASGGLIQNLTGITAGLVIQSPINFSSAAGTLSINAFTNQGTMTVSAGTLDFNGPWLNKGTVAVTGASGTLNLTGTFSTVGTIKRTAGNVNIQGTYTVNGTLAFTAATGSWNLAGGTIANATLTFAGGATLVLTSSGGTLSHVTLGSDLQFPSGGEITVTKGLALGGHTLTLNSAGPFTGITFNDPAPESLSGPGQVVFAGSSPSADFFNTYGAAANPVTLAANVTLSGGGGLIQNLTGVTAGLIIQSPINVNSAAGTFSISGPTNQGTITVSAGTLILTGGWVNKGTITTTGASATADLAGTFSNVGTIKRTAGNVNIQGTYTVNGTLAFTPATGNWNLAGGTIANATLTFAGGASLLFTNSGGRLSHVTLGTDLNFLSGNEISVSQGLLLNGHAITLNSAGPFTGITFDDPAAQTVAGPGQIVFAGSSPTADFLNSYGGAANPVTLGVGVTISASAGLIQSLTGVAQGLINAGTITVTGKNLSIGNFTNRGTFLVSGGNFTLAGATLINTGTINVSAGRTLLLGSGGALTNSGAGVLEGTGTLSATTITNSATISPGATGALSTGTLTFVGAFTQTSSGVIHEELGGAAAGQFDRLVINGAATLAGLLDVYLINGFHPASGKVFNVLSYSSHTGTLTADGLSVGNGITLKAVAGSGSETLAAGPTPADTTKPTISAPALIGAPHAGAVTLTFRVTYSDDVAVDLTTLGAGDLLVTGPGGFSQLATFVSSNKTNNGTPRTAIYQITLSSGTFKSGAYTVAIQANAVKDTHGNAIATGAGGTFVLPA